MRPSPTQSITTLEKTAHRSRYILDKATKLGVETVKRCTYETS